MKIFLIYGEKDAGKTTTCQKILDWLNFKGWNQQAYQSFDKPSADWYGDFCVKGTFHDKAIAIYSAGDEKAHLSEALSFAHESPCCDILIATVRKGIHYIDPLTNHVNQSNDTVEWVTLEKDSISKTMDENEEVLVKNIVGFINT